MMTKRNFRTAEPTDGAIVPLHEHPQYSEVLEELQALEKLHAHREAERKRLLARARGEKVKRSATERAADLLKGGRVDPTPPGDAIQALDEELAILRQAIGEKTRALDVIATDLAYTESEKVKPAFDAAMRDALTAMEKLARAFGAAAGLADQLRRAGDRPSAFLLPDLSPEAVMQLGDPDAVGLSQAWRFRRALEERGIV